MYRSVLLFAVAAILLGQSPAFGQSTPPDNLEIKWNGTEVKQKFLLNWSSDLSTRILDLDRFKLILGAGDKFDFSSDRNASVLWQNIHGKQMPVAVRVRDEYVKRGEKRLINPLAKLTDEQLRYIRGLELEVWNDEIAAQLKKLDTANLLLMVRGEVAIGAGCKLPELPEDLLFLEVYETNNFRGIKDYSSLTRLKKLRLLTIGSRTGPVDCQFLGNASDLEWLRMRSTQIRNWPELGKLKKLAHLDLEGNRSLQNIDFVKDLKQLKSLDISWTDVRNLEPLAGHPKLQEVTALVSRVMELPKSKLPELKTLDLLSCPVSSQNVEAFRKLQPDSAIHHGWMTKLNEALAKVDRLRVRSEGTCHRNVDREVTLAELKDSVKVREFIKLIQVNDNGRIGNCMCCGEPSFEFYSGDHLVLTLGFHHGTSIRWPGGWPGDGSLTAESSKSLNSWLEESVPSIKEANEKERAYAKVEKAANEEFMNCFPAHVRKIFASEGGDLNFEQRENAASRKIIEAMPDEPQRLVACSKAIGITHRLSPSWSSTDGKQRQVLAVLKETSGETFLKVLESNKEDNLVMSGLARIYFFEGLYKKVHEETRPKTLLQLARWSLFSGSEENSLNVMSQLSKANTEESRSLLKELWKARIATVGSSTSRRRDEPSTCLQGMLVLAKAGDRELLPELKQVAPALKGSDKLAAELALAHLGEDVALEAAHFKNQSYTLGYAAMEWAEKQKGTKGLDLLIEHGLTHPWGLVHDEMEKTAMRIIDKKWPKDEAREKLEQWWKEEGKKFVEEQRKKVKN